jgi:hypothetical protein
VTSPKVYEMRFPTDCMKEEVRNLQRDEWLTDSVPQTLRSVREHVAHRVRFPVRNQAWDKTDAHVWKETARAWNERSLESVE